VGSTIPLEFPSVSGEERHFRVRANLRQLGILGAEMVIHEVDARVWLREASSRERRPVMLDSLPGHALDWLAGRGMTHAWLRGLWEPDTTAREALRRSASAFEELEAALPGLELADIDGDLSAIAAYRVRAEFGGDDALEALREDLQRRGVQVLVDFFPAAAGGSHDLSRIAGLVDGAVLAPGELRGPDAAQVDLARAHAIHPGFVLLGRGAPPANRRDIAGSIDVELPALLAKADGAALRAHLAETDAWPARPVRCLEHDASPRAADALEASARFAAAVVAYMSPGWKLIADGQLEGRKARRDPRLSRRLAEAPDGETAAFYESLLEVMAWAEIACGTCSVLPVRPAWEGNSTWGQFVVSLHRGGGGSTLLSAVNFGPRQGQCYVDLTAIEPHGREWVFQDLLGLAVYERGGDDLAGRGLYLDLPAWDYNVFEVVPRGPA
jgi:hypothetical protein